MAGPDRDLDRGVGQKLVKRVLMIAYHFPPFQGSSGVQRTLKFSRYLPDYGWEPIVLTVNPRAYEGTDASQLSEIPDRLVLRRAFALDTARHFAIGGAYSRLLALPDRWVSWWLAAMPAGLRLMRKYRPNVIWSTYPIATAHLIGLTLHNLSGIPWVADFRDSMTEEDYPRDRTTRRVYRWIERHTVTSCSQAVFTAPGTVRMYSERYPRLPSTRWRLIANGYDEENFREAERLAESLSTKRDRILLVHSGLLYPSERNPDAFFWALKDLLDCGKISPQKLTVRLRASGYTDHYQHFLSELGIGHVVSLEPAIPYLDALAEMINADGLLIFQASNCNHQIPAKLYEYLRTGRPILALTDPAGDSASLLGEVSSAMIAPIDSREQISTTLLEFVDGIRNGKGRCPGIDVAQYSRRARTAELAQLLDKLIDRDGACTSVDA
jgi:glycosyltransferase involved in cell wall biosynthesis